LSTTDDIQESPTVWFAVLERAIRDGDYDLAKQAKHELERLGIDVAFRFPWNRRRGRLKKRPEQA